MRSAQTVAESVACVEHVSIRGLVTRVKVLPPERIADVLDLRKMTEIGVPGGAHGAVAGG